MEYHNVSKVTKLMLYYIMLCITVLYIIILYYEYTLVTCAPVHLFNGQANTMASLVHGRYPFGTKISFLCNTGYSLDTTGSNSSITCLTTGVWSHTTPRCNIGNGTIFIRYKLLLTVLNAITFFTSTAKI